MSTVTADRSFEAQHPRGTAGRFAEKANSAPSASLSAPSDSWTATAYRGEPVADRIGRPSDLVVDSGMVLDERQTGPTTYFVEEHLLEDGRYLTSVHHAYVIDLTPYDHDEVDLRLVLESEQFVDDEPNAYARMSRHDRDENDGTTSFTRTTDDVRWDDREAVAAAARQVAENSHIYQEWFNKKPFAGHFDDEHVTTFLDALPLIREAKGYRG